MAFFLFAVLSLLASSVTASPSYTCKSFFVPIKVNNVTTIVLPFPPFKNGYEATFFDNSATSRQQSSTKPNVTSITATYNISAEYCTPNIKTNNSNTLQILTHGLGFDKSYWDFRLPTNKSSTANSYINTALTAGYSTLSYDRLGCGQSPVVNPYTEIQGSVELSILATLTTYARSGGIPFIPAPCKVLHIGHSLGSALTNALAASFPTLSDGIVLTGYSQVDVYQLLFLASTNFHLASTNQPARFANRSSGYLTWGDEFANQYSFLYYPYFEPAVLTYAEAIKYPFTAGEIFSGSALKTNATGFTGPVLYLAAEYDLIYCGGYCPGLYGNKSATYTSFGNSSDVEVYLQPNMGHGINLHKNATGAFGVVVDWATRHGF